MTTEPRAERRRPKSIDSNPEFLENRMECFGVFLHGSQDEMGRPLVRDPSVTRIFQSVKKTSSSRNNDASMVVGEEEVVIMILLRLWDILYIDF